MYAIAASKGAMVTGGGSFMTVSTSSEVESARGFECMCAGQTLGRRDEKRSVLR